MTVAYLNMLLSGAKHASYSNAKVIALLIDSPVDIWCDKEKVRLRKVAFGLYSAAISQEAKQNE